MIFLVQVPEHVNFPEGEISKPSTIHKLSLRVQSSLSITIILRDKPCFSLGLILHVNIICSLLQHYVVDAVIEKLDHTNMLHLHKHCLYMYWICFFFTRQFEFRWSVSSGSIWTYRCTDFSEFNDSIAGYCLHNCCIFGFVDSWCECTFCFLASLGRLRSLHFWIPFVYFCRKNWTNSISLLV